MPSDTEMVPLQEERGVVSVPICAELVTNGPCAWGVMAMPAHLLLSYFFTSTKLCSKLVAPTDNMRPKSGKGDATGNLGASNIAMKAYDYIKLIQKSLFPST